MNINGQNVEWENITRDQLKQLVADNSLTDSMIANLFGVSVNKVKYKKTKWGLTGIGVAYEGFYAENAEIISEMNDNSKEWFMDAKNIDAIAKAITRYAFREGPVEEIHASGSISEAEMKELNVFMVNHIAGLLIYALNGDWLKLRLLVSYFVKATNGWNFAEPELKTVNDIFTMQREAMQRRNT